MALSTEQQCVSAASLRHQLSPARLRYQDATSRMIMAYMLEAPEWLERWEAPVVGAAVMKDGTLGVAFANGQIIYVQDGRTWLDRTIADVVERAELDGSEDAEYLRTWPRVRDNRL